MAWRAPSSPARRTSELDAVRGLALGGMLLVNLGAMSGLLQPITAQEGLDRAASFLVLLLAEGKFYPLFALLFGWGTARRQLIHETKDDGGRFFTPNLRRMAVLGLFGLLHAALLWEGDILIVYAAAGGLLPLARRAPGWLVLTLSAVGLSFSSLLALPGFDGELSNAYAAWVSPLAGPLSGWTTLQGDVSPVYQRLLKLTFKLLFAPAWMGNTLALILLGYSAGLRSFSIFANCRPVWRCLFPSVMLNLFYALASLNPGLLPPDWTGFVRTFSASIGGPLLGMLYAHGIAGVFSSKGQQPLLDSLARLGRVPLTTYLGQSLVGAILISPLVSAKLSPLLLWLLSPLVITTQMVFARLWLRYFSRGPLEAVWRRLSGA